MIGDDDLRDCFAMFAMNGYLSKMACNPRDHGDICDAGENNAEAISRAAYTIADAMLEARNKEPETEDGIVAIKPRKRK
jgi:hypothetical protein